MKNIDYLINILFAFWNVCAALLFWGEHFVACNIMAWISIVLTIKVIMITVEEDGTWYNPAYLYGLVIILICMGIFLFVCSLPVYYAIILGICSGIAIYAIAEAIVTFIKMYSRG